jgi:hypothetical protein
LRKIVGALALSLISGFGLSVPAAAAATPGLSTAKIVIIVGPVEGTTASYIADAQATAAVASLYSSNVVTIYSPYATWANVEPALQGASIVVYFGHGNGWPSPYTPFQEDTKDGLGLNQATSPSNNAHTYYGANYLAKYIKLAPNAVVLLGHLCYSAGNSEAQFPAPTLAVAEQRVDNMGAGWLQTGARAVISEPYATNEGDYITGLFTTHLTINQLWQSAYDFHNDVQTFASARTAWATVQLDPNRNASGNAHFDRAISGDMTLTTDAVLASSPTSPFQRVTLGQSDPVNRSILGGTWLRSLRVR